MSERSIRVNELILRELSHILRTRFREQTVAVTLTEVSVSPDLRAGRVYYSVLGNEQAKIKARSFFTKEYRTLRQLVAQKVVLKYFPKINFIEDDSIARGNRVLDLLGEIDEVDAYSPSASFAEEADNEDGFDEDESLTDGEDTDATSEEKGIHKRASGKGSGKKPGRKGGSISSHKEDDGGRSSYVFDEDDLEYARDIEAEGNPWNSFVDDEAELFDEENDVEYDEGEEKHDEEDV